MRSLLKTPATNVSTPPDGQPRNQTERGLALISLLGVCYFILIVSIFHALRSDYDPFTRFMSEYAVGIDGWLMTSAFGGLGIGSLVLVANLYAASSNRSRSYVGLVLLFIWSMAIVLSGVFPSDLQGAPETTTGKIHNQLALLAFPSVCLGTILISVKLRKHLEWKKAGKLGLLLAVLATVSFISLPVFFFPARLPGLGQRIFLTWVLAWLVLMAWQCRIRLTEKSRLA